MGKPCFGHPQIWVGLRARTNCAFFKIADGYGGHTQVLALFDRAQSPGYSGSDAATSTVDHIACEIALTGRLANVLGPLLVAFLFTHHGYASIFAYVATGWVLVAVTIGSFGPLTKGRTLA